MLYNCGMKTYTAAKARTHFAEILNSVEQGEEITITKYKEPIATITRPKKKRHKIAPPGYLRSQGWSFKMADDFDAIPEGFEDYV